MARPGRKRKPPTEREERQTGPSPALIRRAAEAAKAQGADPLFGFPIGKLMLAKVIDEYELSAASRFHRDMSRWIAAHGVNPTPSAVDYNRVHGRGGSNAEADARAQTQWTKLYDTLTHEIGPRAYDITYRACVCGEAITLPDDRRVLLLALDRLAVFYGARSQMRRAA